MNEPLSLVPTASEPARRMAYVIWASVSLVVAAALFTLLRSSSASAADPATTIHTQGNLTMEWSIRQYPAIALQNNGFQLRIAEAQNEPQTGAAVAVKLEMLDMVCGDYTFELRETSPGVYEGDGVPLMPGLWRATASVKSADGDSFTVVRTLKAEY